VKGSVVTSAFSIRDTKILAEQTQRAILASFQCGKMSYCVASTESRAGSMQMRGTDHHSTATHRDSRVVSGKKDARPIRPVFSGTKQRGILIVFQCVKTNTRSPAMARRSIRAAKGLPQPVIALSLAPV